MDTNVFSYLHYVGSDAEALSCQRATREGRERERAFFRVLASRAVERELANGGKALIRASQTCIGHKNDLGMEVACEKGGLAWRQEDAELITLRLPSGVERQYWRAAVERVKANGKPVKM